MLFNSWEFVVLLLVAFACYYLVPVPGQHVKTWQVSLLLIASSVFYAWEQPTLLFLLAFSCLGNGIATSVLVRCREQGNEVAGRRVLGAAVAANLGLLAMFKYSGFIARQLPTGWLPEPWVGALCAIPLPVGISFYTFHGISLLVDVWRREVTPEETSAIFGGGRRTAKGVRDLSFYIVFFPQLVAGPIVKAHEFLGQISAKCWKDIDWGVVVRSLIAGYFLKMVVADNLAEQTVTLAQPWISSLGPLDLVALLYGYGFQIFADFAGYSLIAIGLGALFGYRLPVNFNFPYLSTSITEFWRRWHISLSSWLRDYLYIPLGGNKSGVGRTYVNLFLVMFLGGLWHGAAWKFAIWGTLHGVFLAGERFVLRRRGKTQLATQRSKIRAVCGWIYAFHTVTLLWLTFLMPDLDQILLFFRELAIPQRWHGSPLFVGLLFSLPVVLGHVFAWVREHHPALAARFRGSYVEGLVYGAMLFLILTNSGAPQGFIYFQF